jgi:hypothetical protein
MLALHGAKKKRKEKITPIYIYRREYEHVGLSLITVYCDATSWSKHERRASLPICYFLHKMMIFAS